MILHLLSPVPTLWILGSPWMLLPPARAALRIGNFGGHRAHLRRCARMDDLTRRTDRSNSRHNAVGREPIARGSVGAEDACDFAGGDVSRVSERGRNAWPEACETWGTRISDSILKRPVSGFDRPRKFPTTNRSSSSRCFGKSKVDCGPYPACKGPAPCRGAAHVGFGRTIFGLRGNSSLARRTMHPLAGPV